MNKRKIKGFSIIEYTIFITIILTALYVSKDFISRAIMGHWRQAGDSFAFGRQYDPSRTLDCSYEAELNKWYDQSCFDQRRLRCTAASGSCELTVMNECSTSACNE